MLEDGKVTNRDLVVASTRHLRVRLRLVSSNRERFAHYKHISYFFNKYTLSLYVPTREPLGYLLGFWLLSKTLRWQKPLIGSRNDICKYPILNMSLTHPFFGSY